jgi:hypothetical protein
VKWPPIGMSLTEVSHGASLNERGQVTGLAGIEARVSAVRSPGPRFIMRSNHKTSKLDLIIVLDNLAVRDVAAALGGDTAAFERPGGDRRGLLGIPLCTPANERRAPAQLGTRE